MQGAASSVVRLVRRGLALLPIPRAGLALKQALQECVEKFCGVFGGIAWPVVNGMRRPLDLLPIRLFWNVRGQEQLAEHGLHLGQPEGVLG